MSKELQVTTAPSVIQAMADRFGMDKRAFEATLRATVVPSGATQEQFVAFLLVAKEYNLNPLTKEIYAFPAKGGGIQPIVGVDGWTNIINSNPAFDGCEFQDIIEDGKLIAIKCRIFRKDRSHPTEATEYMDECKRATDPWRTAPRRMLRHKSLIQCARYAFGYSGIVDPDEAERIIENTSPKTGVLSDVIAKAKEAKQESKSEEKKELQVVTEEQPSLFVEEPAPHVVEDVAYSAALASITESKNADDLDKVMRKMNLDSFPLEVQDNLQKASERKFSDFNKQQQKGE